MLCLISERRPPLLFRKQNEHQYRNNTGRTYLFFGVHDQKCFEKMKKSCFFFGLHYICNKPTDNLCSTIQIDFNLTHFLNFYKIFLGLITIKKCFGPKFPKQRYLINEQKLYSIAIGLTFPAFDY